MKFYFTFLIDRSTICVRQGCWNSVLLKVPGGNLEICLHLGRKFVYVYILYGRKLQTPGDGVIEAHDRHM